MKLAIIITIALLFGAWGPEILAISSLPPDLLAAFNEQPELNVMLIMNKQVDHVLSSINARRFATSADKTSVMVKELQEFTRESQGPVIAFINRRRSPSQVGRVQGFWIANRISVEKATVGMLQEVVDQHGEDIQEIREAKSSVRTDQPGKLSEEEEGSLQRENYPGQWDILNIQGQAALATGYTGQNVVVGLIDTGVMANHVDIKDKIRPTNNWFDAITGSLVPSDPNGHGTYCTALVTGTKVGVAPGSQSIACRAFDANGNSTEASLLKCAEWITCPTLPDGSEPDCSQKPNICSNAWGGDGGDDYFNDAINTWRAADIIPIFALGNDGPECRTASSPGDQPNVISVGAFKADNLIALFSSRGPSTDIKKPLIKPEMAAPGFYVESAWAAGGVDAFSQFSGTGVACSELAGAAAILLSKKPDASFDQILSALENSAYKHDVVRPNDCNIPVSPSNYPNNIYGHGNLRVYDALNAL